MDPPPHTEVSWDKRVPKIFKVGPLIKVGLLNTNVGLQIKICS